MKSVTEWSTEFDILWNNIMSNQAPGLTKYEKSVFLTRAEEAVVTGIYRGTISVPFEATEEVTDYLSPLVKQADGILRDSGIHHIITGSSVYQLPKTCCSGRLKNALLRLIVAMWMRMWSP